MQTLTKQLSLLLLSCLLLTPSGVLAALSQPFLPIYSTSDNLLEAVEKPKIIYTELKDSKIVIPNMPSYDSQDDLGECRAFSIRTIMQKYTCDAWKKEIPDCAHPPADLDISSFGMLIYTNRNLTQDDSFQPNQDVERNMYSILLEISKNPSFLLKSCKPLDKIVNSFSMNGEEGLKVRDKFFDYLKKLYTDRKKKTEAEIADCPECLAEIEKNTGLNKDLINLKKALSKDNYDKFLYTLLFEGCEPSIFADGFHPVSFPNDSIDATPTDAKNKIIEGLKKGKPVLFPSLCMVVDANNKCSMGHSIVISGFKKVCDINKNCKDVFKVHNSWGESWQKANNDGWVDADNLMANIIRYPNQNSTSVIKSAAVIWLEP